VRCGDDCVPICYCLISTEPGHAESVLETLKKIDAVEEAYMVYGTYDIVAKIKTENMGKLKDNIIHARFLNQVQSTQTLVVMSET
jgi:DNA-binding Lrp family transcriptional regulator